MLRRGTVVWVDFEPVRGSESNKRRPAVVVASRRTGRRASTSPCALNANGIAVVAETVLPAAN